MSFPDELKRALPNWVRDGLVDESQADAIAARYPVDRGATSGLLLPALYTLGACLVGGGAISFVAAHWDSIPVPVRIGLLMGSMLACEITGYVLWRVRDTHARLGEALILLGAVVFGASIFLIAQMYHLHGPPHAAFGWWALGSLAVAYATWSAPVLVLATLCSFVWSTGWIEAHPHQPLWYPVAVAAACAPYLLRQRSPLVLAGLLFAVGTSIAVGTEADSGQEWAHYLALMAAGAFGRGLALWLDRGDATSDLAVPARLLGGVAILPLAFGLGFDVSAEQSVIRELWVADGWLWVTWVSLLWLGAVVFYAVALRSHAGVPPRTCLAMLGACILVSVGIAAGHHVVLPVAANLALIGVSGGLVWDAVSASDRRRFWLGLGLVTVVLVRGFFVWDTLLMLKSAVFAVCGIAVIVGGIRFEKRLQEVES